MAGSHFDQPTVQAEERSESPGILDLSWISENASTDGFQYLMI